MTRRILKGIVVTVAVTVGVFALIRAYFPDAEILSQGFVSVAMGGLALMVRRLADELSSKPSTAPIPVSDADTKPVVVYMFGSKGSGKTTLLKHALYAGALQEPAPSKGYRTYESQVSCGEGTQAMVAVRDYAGEKPGEAVANIPEEEYIDVLVLITDLAPAYEISKDGPGKSSAIKYSQEDLMKSFSAAPEKKIAQRKDQQGRYLNEAMIHVLLTFMIRRNLRRIILVINKLDIIEELINNGRLATEENPIAIAKSLYATLIDTIEEATVNTDIDFKVHAVSALKDLHLRDLRNDMICEMTLEKGSLQ